MGTPVSSEYNYETSEADKVRSYVQLVPGAAPAAEKKKNKHGVASYKQFYTSDPK